MNHHKSSGECCGKCGTNAGYSYGCRQPMCRAAHADYRYKRRNAGKHRPGSTVGFDAAAVKREMERQGVSGNGLSRSIGLADNAVFLALQRSKCGIYTLDAISCRLGHHPSAFSDEWWMVA